MSSRQQIEDAIAKAVQAKNLANEREEAMPTMTNANLNLSVAVEALDKAIDALWHAHQFAAD